MEHTSRMTQAHAQGGGQTYAGYNGSSGGDTARSHARGLSKGGGQGQVQSGAQNTSTVMPPVDIYEDESCITVVADMPGVSREQLVVRVQGDNLVIEGTASAPAVTGEMELLYGEIMNPQYRRSFTLSRELDAGKIDAKLADGVLRLTIPRAEEAKPRRINVNVG